MYYLSQHPLFKKENRSSFLSFFCCCWKWNNKKWVWHMIDEKKIYMHPRHAFSIFCRLSMTFWFFPRLNPSFWAQMQKTYFFKIRNFLNTAKPTIGSIPVDLSTISIFLLVFPKKVTRQKKKMLLFASFSVRKTHSWTRI